MSRIFTIVVILLLMAVVALVPRIGTEEEVPDLGDGYAYREDTLARFRLLLEDEGWTLADPPRNPQGMLEAVHERTGLTFVLIPRGAFLMGSDERQGEKPIRKVCVPAFLMCRTECTQRAWECACRDEDGFSFEGAQRPAERVTWLACRQWCMDVDLRLPSESEWEYACQANTRTRFSFGASDADLPQHAWCYENSEWRTHPVGQKAPNGWGLHDMHGNVWEWCEDWWGRYSNAPADGSAQEFCPSKAPIAWASGEPVYLSFKISRGGCWDSDGEGCRSANRKPFNSLHSSKYVGFRPAASLPRSGVVR